MCHFYSKELCNFAYVASGNEFAQLLVGIILFSQNIDRDMSVHMQTHTLGLKAKAEGFSSKRTQVVSVAISLW